jgi:hypothetical protein
VADREKPMRYVYPLDPKCPVVAEFLETLFDDPTTMAMGAPIEDITEEFERRHRKQCKRCQEYGVRKNPAAPAVQARGRRGLGKVT